MIKALLEKLDWKLLTLLLAFLSLVFAHYTTSTLYKSYEESLFPAPNHGAQVFFSAKEDAAPVKLALISGQRQF